MSDVVTVASVVPGLKLFTTLMVAFAFDANVKPIIIAFNRKHFFKILRYFAESSLIVVFEFLIISSFNILKQKSRIALQPYIHKTPLGNGSFAL